MYNLLAELITHLDAKLHQINYHVINLLDHCDHAVM